MTAPPSFASLQDHLAHIDDVDFWRPYVAEILARHGLTDGSVEPVAGHNATWPTFVCGEVVVKLFGGLGSWRASFERERAALALVATDPQIVAPRLLADARLFEDVDEAWPYLLTSLVRGVVSWRADLSAEERRALASDLGHQIRRVHALPRAGIASDDDLELDVIEAARRSSLPPHLIAQIDTYLTGLGPRQPVFVHGDLVANHAYVEDGRLVGLIDWGDAMIADRHFEIIQVFRDLFACDKALLRIFLEASDWPVDRHFPGQAMGQSLRRQAVMLALHHGGDVFEPIAERYPLEDIPTLEDLATELFTF